MSRHYNQKRKPKLPAPLHVPGASSGIYNQDLLGTLRSEQCRQNEITQVFAGPHILHVHDRKVGKDQCRRKTQFLF